MKSILAYLPLHTHHISICRVFCRTFIYFAEKQSNDGHEMADLKFLMWYIHSEVELYDWYLFKQYYNFSICKISFKKVKVYSWSQLTYSIVIFIARDLYTRTLPIDSRARAAKKFSSKPCRPTGLENRIAQSLSAAAVQGWQRDHYITLAFIYYLEDRFKSCYIGQNWPLSFKPWSSE